MTEKEKAEAYDEAIERAKKWHNISNPIYCNIITEKIFPELKESEDEEIRKEIISILRNAYWTSNRNRFNELVAWLEKQGKKSTDKIEPRFNVGDWVVFITSGSIYQVEKKENYEYTLRNIHGGLLCVDFSNEELIREWTIEDAEDGDVLVNSSNIFIFHFINNKRLMGYCHVNMDDGNFYNDIGRNECFCMIDAPVTPATKEQRDLLFQKIKEAGYEWDAYKKELKKKIK